MHKKSNFRSERTTYYRHTCKNSFYLNHLKICFQCPLKLASTCTFKMIPINIPRPIHKLYQLGVTKVVQRTVNVEIPNLENLK